MAYTIVVTPAARRDLGKLPQDVARRVDRCIVTLAENPRPMGCKKLQGVEGLYRVRVGDWRVIYQIEDQRVVVVIVRVRHRGDVYRGV